jgi:hypothetical protein
VMIMGPAAGAAVDPVGDVDDRRAVGDEWG